MRGEDDSERAAPVARLWRMK